MTSDNPLDDWRKMSDEELTRRIKDLSTIPDEALRTELNRPERLGTLKTAWAIHTQAQRVNKRGGTNGGRKKKEVVRVDPFDNFRDTVKAMDPAAVDEFLRSK